MTYYKGESDDVTDYRVQMRQVLRGWSPLAQNSSDNGVGWNKIDAKDKKESRGLVIWCCATADTRVLKINGNQRRQGEGGGGMWGYVGGGRLSV